MGVVVALLALLIAAFLYLGGFQAGETTQRTRQTVVAVDNSKAFACKSNRQTVEREIQMWLVNNPGETPSLAAVGSTARCPQGGDYALDGLAVRCSKHDQP